MQGKFYLGFFAAAGLFFGAALADQRLALKALPASPHQLTVLKDFAPVVREIQQRLGKGESDKPDFGEFARFEAVEIDGSGAGEAGGEYPASLLQKAIIDRGPPKAHEEDKR